MKRKGYFPLFPLFVFTPRLCSDLCELNPCFRHQIERKQNKSLCVDKSLYLLSFCSLLSTKQNQK